MVLCTTVVSAQSSTKKSIEGVWKVTEIVVAGQDASNVSSPQPGLIIFTQKYYSVMWVPGNEPRTLFKGENPTNEEKIAAYDSFIANAGSYEVVDGILTLHPMVSRSPNFMSAVWSVTSLIASSPVNLTIPCASLRTCGSERPPYSGWDTKDALCQ